MIEGEWTSKIFCEYEGRYTQHNCHITEDHVVKVCNTCLHTVSIKRMPDGADSLEHQQMEKSNDDNGADP